MMSPDLRLFVWIMVSSTFITGCKPANLVEAPVSPAPEATQSSFVPRVRLVAYDEGDGSSSTPLIFQINPLDGGRTQFLKIGDTVDNTHIKLTAFDVNTKALTVTDTVTRQSARLSLPKPTESAPVVVPPTP